MSEKDIKTKPKKSPKVAVKSKDAVVNTVKDAKSVIKDTLVKKAVESKLGTEQGYSETQKADTEASERVESAAYTTVDVVYLKGKAYAQNKIKEHRQKVKTRENEILENKEPTPEEPETPDKEPKTVENEPKTDENYNINEQPSQNPKNAEQAKSKVQEKATVKIKEEYMKSQSETFSHGVKTKTEYQKRQTEPIKSPYNNTQKSKQTITSVKRNTANSNKALKTRDNVVGKPKSVVKSGSPYITKTAKKKPFKITGKAVKTQKEVTKKAAKKAAKQTRQAAIKAAKIAKVVAIKIAKK